jgi:hypothetical protein
MPGLGRERPGARPRNILASSPSIPPAPPNFPSSRSLLYPHSLLQLQSLLFYPSPQHQLCAAEVARHFLILDKSSIEVEGLF